MDQLNQMRLAAMLMNAGGRGGAGNTSQPGMFQFPAYAGLRNTPALPAYEQPGAVASQYIPPMASASRQGNYGDAPAPMPAAAPMPMPAAGAMPGMSPDDAARNAADIANGGRQFNPMTDTQDPMSRVLVNGQGVTNPEMSPGAGALPDVQSAIAMLVKQGKLGPEWAR